MPSKRRQSLAKKRADKKNSQTRPTGKSRYATKRERMAGGWNNPRSPIQREQP